MPRVCGFDNEKYLAEQSQAILERVTRASGKLYLEFGGKLLFDMHAARVLPGYDPNVKMRLLQKLSGQTDIILCIHAGAIERRKVRADFGITYDSDALKLIDDIRSWNLDVCGVVITCFEGQPAAKLFQNRLERRNIRVYLHRPTRGYPDDVNLIVSEEGYGANPFIETERPLVVVTGPGPGSGKLATSLSQLYHEHRRGRRAGYAKFETFPIWNLPLQHPVNVAYEAATLDLGDCNLIDPHHMEAYGVPCVNYNRDVGAFPLLRCILQRINGETAGYRSPTDMGVNRAGFAIVNDEAVQAAARQEIIRRSFRAHCEYALGMTDKTPVHRAGMIMKSLQLTPEDRPVVGPARRAMREGQAAGKGSDGICCGAALELASGAIVTGKNSPLLHAASSLLLNAVKSLAGIPDQMHLLQPNVVESITNLKENVLRLKAVSLDVEETLVALAASTITNPAAKLAVEKLPELRGCDVHLSHIPPQGDEAGLRKLGVNLTSDPEFSSRNLLG
ncbi:MAG: hypothetical protein BWZ02_00420 [Lentisphaerae bacterium ADurb.BinA184]|nr:MAG: hypothetical protein BWZ02_00420 [Lentisphaerae bacterium ADurb.BinA184]